MNLCRKCRQEVGRSQAERDLDDLIVERPCLEIIQNSEVIDQIRVINGLKKGNITRVLRGEHVGTIIRK